MKNDPWKDTEGVAWPRCTECGSEDIHYENPRTGGEGYVCCDCGHVFTAEEARVFDEWEKKLTQGKPTNEEGSERDE